MLVLDESEPHEPIAGTAEYATGARDDDWDRDYP